MKNYGFLKKTSKTSYNYLVQFYELLSVMLLYCRFYSYINGLTMTVSIRDARRGMETFPPLGYFRSYIGKSVGS